MLADVGLLGMPNAGKSTLIAAISNARPKIADYPFTTLHPNLGVVRVAPEQSFVVADIPGLIEGAAEGAGLGHQFLRHLQRTRLLLHLVDFAPFDDASIRSQQAQAPSSPSSKKYDPELHAKPRWLVLNKLDMVPADERAARVKDFVKRLRWKGPVFSISALTREGCEALVRAVYDHVAAQVRPSCRTSRDPRFDPVDADGASMSEALRGARRIVVKVGSSLVTNEGRGVDAEAIGNWCRQMAALARAGPRARDGLERRDRRRHEAARLAGAAARRARAAGRRRGRPDGPGADLRIAAARARHRQRAGAAHARRPRRSRALPERALDAASRCSASASSRSSTRTTPSSTTRSSSATTTRSARWSPTCVDADALVILTDQRGLFSADPRKDPAARLIDEGAAGDPELERMAGGAGSALGRGGMLTKVLAAKRAARSGASTVIAWGREPRRAAAPGRRRERSAPRSSRRRRSVAARKQWMSDHLQLRGAVVVDDGAARQAARRRQEPAADRRRRGRGRLPSRRRDRRAPRRAARRSRAAWATTAAPRRA